METPDETPLWNLTVIILAAGKGKRMNNPDMPKVMAMLGGVPLIGHVVRQALRLRPEQVIVVAGHHKEQVIGYVRGEFGGRAEFAVQEQQLGTGLAVIEAEPLLQSYSGDVLILSGDTPLLRASTLMSFANDHRRFKPVVVASALTMRLDDPAGYGRIIRSPDGEFLKIVEEKDATPEEKAVFEVNSGIYIVSSHQLFPALRQLGNANAQGEYYLTDVIGILRGKNFACNAIPAPDPDELHGVNSPAELDRAEAIYRRRGEMSA